VSWILNVTLMVLGVLSTWSWAIALTKAWRQFQENSLSKRFMEAYERKSDWGDVQSLSEVGDGDFSVVLQAGFSACTALSGPEGEGMSLAELKETIGQELRKAVLLMMRQREWGMAVLASIGSVSPFIGLFGTVWGIMRALQTISQSGQASIDVVAGPIGEALITTAIGIATAVPAVLAYNYFLRQRRLRAALLDEFAGDFLRLAMRNRKVWGDQ
jgi:biopolymer transport protein ExbB